MANFLSNITDTVTSIPKAVGKGVRQAAKLPAKVAKAPAQVTRTIKDSVHLNSKPRRTEVSRRDVVAAARPKKNSAAPVKAKVTQKKSKPKAKKTHNTAAPMSLEVIREMAPAKQRAYFQRVKEQNGGSIGEHAQKENRVPSFSEKYRLGQVLAESDQTSMAALGRGWKNLKEADAKLDRAIQGTEGVHQAKLVARDLEKKKIARFEKKLEVQSPERYQRYKKNQHKDDMQLASEANSETWKRRDLQLEEEARSRAILAKDPSEYKLSETHKKNVERADKSIVDGHFQEAWHAADAAQELKAQEKELFPNKQAWLDSLTPEARAAHHRREQHDTASVVRSAVAREQAIDNIQDVVSLGTGTLSAESGIKDTLLEVGTLGTASVAKVAGTDLGRATAYAEHADSLERSGLLNQAVAADEKAGELATSGGLNLVMAGGSAVGLGTSAHKLMMKQLKKKLAPLPSRTVTVTTKPRALPGTTRAADPTLAKSALSFDDAMAQAERTGLKEQLNVLSYQYKKKPVGFWEVKWKPEWERVSVNRELTVHGVEHDFAKRVGATLEDLPEATYQGMKDLQDLHVADFAEFKNADGTISSGTQGAVRVNDDSVNMILNRRNIDAPLNQQMNTAIHKNGLGMSRGKMLNSAAEEGFKRERLALQEMADKNLRETMYHEIGHLHDELHGLTETGRYRGAGPAYSEYAAETGSAAEDLAEGYSRILEQRHQIRKAHGPDADWRGMVMSDPVYGAKNEQILRDLIDNVVYEWDEVI